MFEEGDVAPVAPTPPAIVALDLVVSSQLRRTQSIELAAGPGHKRLATCLKPITYGDRDC